MFVLIPEISFKPNPSQSIRWSVSNSSLYANDDQVFPSSPTMQLHVPRYDGSQKTPAGLVLLSYSIDARPLSAQETPSSLNIVRVSVRILNQNGESVTPNSVLIDLLNHEGGNPRIVRIQIESNEPKVTKTSDRVTSWLSKSPSTPKESSQHAKEVQPSRTGYIFSPYWSPPSWFQRFGRPHRHPKTGRPDQTLMHLMRPVIVPALLGSAAGLIACFVGFVICRVANSFSSRSRRLRYGSHYSLQSMDIENSQGTEETAPEIPNIQQTFSDEKILN